MGLQILDPRFKSGWRLQKKRHASACLFFRVSFSEAPMAKIENRERKPRRRGLHVARGDFSCSASQNHRTFICCTSFPNRACSVGLRSADCRCQPGYCTACSRGTSASARFRAWPRTGCRTSCRHSRATIRALTMSCCPAGRIFRPRRASSCAIWAGGMRRKPPPAALDLTIRRDLCIITTKSLIFVKSVLRPPETGREAT